MSSMAPNVRQRRVVILINSSEVILRGVAPAARRLTMPRDRYLKIILTVIAIELGWLSVKDVAVPVSAQQTQQNQQQAGQLTPVVIRGIDLPCGGNTINCRETSLPVSVTRTTAPLRIAVDAPLPVDARGTVRIRQDQAILVETGDRPLLIQSVPPSAAPRPGIPDGR
jgi:hypothetical protein